MWLPKSTLFQQHVSEHVDQYVCYCFPLFADKATMHHDAIDIYTRNHEHSRTQACCICANTRFPDFLSSIVG